VGAKIDVGAGSPGVSAGFSVLPCGVSVRWRAARTLCSICERRAEYIERLSTDFRRRTKKTATMPTTATNGPMSKITGIGADYRRSVHV
jgi:hypothetical protein